MENSTNSTVLITGCSSGYGLATAKLFLERGWNVIATMRTLRDDLLPKSDSLRILPLDITDPDSIANVVRQVGPIDVLVNNAGIGLVGALESTPLSVTRQIFETNVFGLMAMCQAFAPQFRTRKSGVIVNVTSSVTLTPMPLVTTYAASKKAAQGFSESLSFELGHFGVRVKIVEPGYAPTTNFGNNMIVKLEEVISPEYVPFATPVLNSFVGVTQVTQESDVAEAIWEAVFDQSGKLHYPAGPDAVALAANSRR